MATRHNCKYFNRAAVIYFFLQNKWLPPISHSLKTNLRIRGLQVKALTTIEVLIYD